MSNSLVLAARLQRRCSIAAILIRKLLVAVTAWSFHTVCLNFARAAEHILYCQDLRLPDAARTISSGIAALRRKPMQLWQSTGMLLGVMMRRSLAAMTAASLTCFAAPTATLAQNAYITNEGGTVSVIDTVTNTVIGTPISV